MSKPIRVLLIVLAVIVVVAGGGWASRGMVLNAAADEVIRKFQAATCEQLKTQKDEPASIMKRAAVGFLHAEPQARVAFIDKIAAPVLNKMIECGMAP
jgi:CDP-diacylglycerol pyrophosphatase